MPPRHIRICNGRVCGENAERLMGQVSHHYKTAPGKTTEQANLDYCHCTGHCEKGPNVIADGKIYHKSKAKSIVEQIDNEKGVYLSEPDIEAILADDELFDF